MSSMRQVEVPESSRKNNAPVYLFRDAWRWTAKERRLVDREVIEPVLHVPCGGGHDGDVTVDIHTLADVKADMNALPFRDHSFNTIISDPPWINPREWDVRWCKEFARVARKKVIMRTGQWFYSLPRPWKVTHTWYVVRLNNAMLNFWFVWENLEAALDE